MLTTSSRIHSLKQDLMEEDNMEKGITQKGPGEKGRGERVKATGANIKLKSLDK